MRKNLACFVVAGAGLLAPMTILHAQAPEPGRHPGPVAGRDVTPSHELGVAEQGNLELRASFTDLTAAAVRLVLEWTDLLFFAAFRRIRTDT
ncbi:MAG: hypothetical protein HYS05_09680 [Acidobacteria bacterium]|nr:hypothetical protein [Acidobacteriota bacterium]